MNLHGDANIRVGVSIRYARCSNREFAHDTLAYIASQKIPSIKEVSVRAIDQWVQDKFFFLSAEILHAHFCKHREPAH